MDYYEDGDLFYGVFGLELDEELIIVFISIFFFVFVVKLRGFCLVWL